MSKHTLITIAIIVVVVILSAVIIVSAVEKHCCEWSKCSLDRWSRSIRIGE